MLRPELLGSLLTAVTDNIGLLIAGRAIEGSRRPPSRSACRSRTTSRSTPTSTPCSGSPPLIALFGWTQLRIKDPLVDLRALRRRPIVLTTLAAILFGFALFASFLGTASSVEAPEASGYGFGSSLLVGAANGLNSLYRTLGSSLASAIGDSILAGSTVIWGSSPCPR